VKRSRMCVYLDIELSKWIKKHAIGEYRSFSSWLNKMMLDHKHEMERSSNIKTLSSETRN